MSAKYKGWYLGFNRKGWPKKGSRTTQRQQEVHFMKRQPKGRVDPLEEFRFTPVTKRTRRARRLKANSKRNWVGQWDSTKWNCICKSAVVLKENHPKDVTSVKRQNNERVKDVLFLYFHENWVFPNSRIPLGWCHRANVSVMLFILDKLKDLRKNSCRFRRHPRLNCSAEGVLFSLTMGAEARADAML